MGGKNGFAVAIFTFKAVDRWDNLRRNIFAQEALEVCYSSGETARMPPLHCRVEALREECI